MFNKYMNKRNKRFLKIKPFVRLKKKEEMEEGNEDKQNRKSSIPIPRIERKKNLTDIKDLYEEIERLRNVIIESNQREFERDKLVIKLQKENEQYKKLLEIKNKREKKAYKELTAEEKLEISKEKADRKIIDRTIMKERERIWKENPKEILDNEEFNEISDKQIKEEIEKENEMKNSFPVKKYRLILLTINPESEVWDEDIKGFKETIEGFISKEWIKESIYVIEQRGNRGVYGGVHSHILIYREDNEQSFERKKFEMKTHRYLDDRIWGEEVPTEKQLNILYVKEEDKEKVMNYILGKKKGKDKQVKVENDKLMRKENNIENYYIKGNYFAL